MQYSCNRKFVCCNNHDLYLYITWQCALLCYRAHGSNLARPVIIYDIIHSLMCQVLHIVDFLGSRRMETAPTSIEVILRPTQSQSDEPSDLHPIMNLARRCLTSVIEPTPMSRRRIP